MATLLDWLLDWATRWAGTPRPWASTLNVAPGATAANEIIAKVGAGGQVQFFASVATDLVVDVVGWIAGGTSTTPTTTTPTTTTTTTTPSDRTTTTTVVGDPQLPKPPNATAFQAVDVVPADRIPVARAGGGDRP